MLADLRAFAKSRCDVVGTTVDVDGRAAIDAGADCIVVIGGDGTLIGVARSLGDDQLPLIGVNVGKLGFLTEFSVDEFRTNFDMAVGQGAAISHRMALDVTVEHGDARSSNLAINDCVIRAGQPFRLITLGLSLDGEHMRDVRADGLIVCTPSGSTAHNLSAGGPIMEAGVEAIGLTPLCPHSLTHRPLVIECGAVIGITAVEVNVGTTAIIDGQESLPLKQGDRVTIRRAQSTFQVVRNPAHAKWHKLVTKMHWGQPPPLD